MIEGLDSIEVALAGRWSRRLRGGVEDIEWIGTAAGSFAGILFVRENGPWRWCKSAPPVDGPELRITFAHWIGAPTFSFAVSFHRAHAASVAMTLADDPERACRVASTVRPGRIDEVAWCAGAVAALLLLPASAVRVGRNRLIRVRDELAQPLPEPMRTLLTRGRSGVL